MRAVKRRFWEILLKCWNKHWGGAKIDEFGWVWDGEFALHQLIHQETIQVGSGLPEETFHRFEVVSNYQSNHFGNTTAFVSCLAELEEDTNGRNSQLDLYTLLAQINVEHFKCATYIPILIHVKIRRRINSSVRTGIRREMVWREENVMWLQVREGRRRMWLRRIHQRQGSF